MALAIDGQQRHDPLGEGDELRIEHRPNDESARDHGKPFAGLGSLVRRALIGSSSAMWCSPHAALPHRMRAGRSARAKSLGVFDVQGSSSRAETAASTTAEPIPACRATRHREPTGRHVGPAADPRHASPLDAARLSAEADRAPPPARRHRTHHALRSAPEPADGSGRRGSRIRLLSFPCNIYTSTAYSCKWICNLSHASEIALITRNGECRPSSAI